MKYDTEDYIRTPLPHQAKLLKLFDQMQPLVIFDIGACECLDSIRYSILFPKASVYAFEPLPKNIERGKAYISAYQRDNITLVEEALSNQTGTAKFFVSSGKPENVEASVDWDFGNKSSSLLPPDQTLQVHQWLKFEEEIEVKTNTLAGFCLENHLREIDFIHLDVQGAELLVLEGAADFLQKIKVIWLEVEKVSLYKNQPLQDQVETFMKKRHFIKVMDTVDKVAGDQLYVSRFFFPNEKPLSPVRVFFQKIAYKVRKKLKFF